jgi:hypothetical protein
VSPAVALELGYLNSFQERANGVDYFNRDIIRSVSFIRLKYNRLEFCQEYKI